MAVTILLSRLAVTWLIVLKQLAEAIASLMAQLKNGQEESITLDSVPTQQNISQKYAFNKSVALNLFFFPLCLFFFFIHFFQNQAFAALASLSKRN